MNKFFIGLVCCLLIVQSSNLKAQENSNKNWWVLPGALIGLGIVSSSQSIKEAQVDVYNQSFTGFHTKVDDFLQYTPTLINIGLNLAHPNPKTRNEKIGRFFIGSLAYATVTQGLKRTLEVTRPNGGEHSFPSGHAATVFFGSHLLAKSELVDKPWIGYAGYGLATTTALLRMANNEHWLSDVLVGAGIGIASAELSYYLYPKLKKAWDKKHAFQMNPIIGNQFYAIQMQINLNQK